MVSAGGGVSKPEDDPRCPPPLRASVLRRHTVEVGLGKLAKQLPRFGRRTRTAAVVRRIGATPLFAAYLPLFPRITAFCRCPVACAVFYCYPSIPRDTYRRPNAGLSGRAFAGLAAGVHFT